VKGDLAAKEVSSFPAQGEVVTCLVTPCALSAPQQQMPDYYISETKQVDGFGIRVDRVY
jgi:hypothetical protein